jgi:tetratricopeptide (TPR) repeat protein
LAESLALARELGSKQDIATALTELAWVAYYGSEYHLAEALATEGLNLYRGLRSIWGIAFSLSNLGAVAHARGDQARALGFYKQSLRLYRDAGEKPMIACCLEGLGSVACTQEQWQYATQLLGMAATLREAMGAPLPPVTRTSYEGTVGDLRKLLGDDLFRAAWAAGQALPLDGAMTLALEDRTGIVHGS